MLTSHLPSSAPLARFTAGCRPGIQRGRRLEWISTFASCLVDGRDAGFANHARCRLPLPLCIGLQCLCGCLFHRRVLPALPLPFRLLSLRLVSFLWPSLNLVPILYRLYLRLISFLWLFLNLVPFLSRLYLRAFLLTTLIDLVRLIALSAVCTLLLILCRVLTNLSDRWLVK